MKTMLEAERRQFLAATSGLEGHARKEGGKSTAPIVPMTEYFRQLEQFGPLFPKPKFTPAKGEHWQL